MRYRRWSQPLVGRSERWLRDRGTTPIVTWEPYEVTLAQIASGSEDAWIREQARAMRAFDAPIMLRFAHEMNGNWYPWSGVANATGGRVATGAQVYRLAWRRIWRLFHAEGATNVVWDWCPNWRSYPQVRGNELWRYYPGDRFVDWVAISAYNRGPYSETKRWRQLREMVQPVYRLYGNRKPMMIRETGSVEAGGSKAKWIYTAARDLRSRFPDVAAFVWFEDGHPTGFEFQLFNGRRVFVSVLLMRRNFPTKPQDFQL